MNTALIAGLCSGIAGLLVFLTLHQLWIKPIWFILPPGLVIAALGGLAVGWSYAEIKAGLPLNRVWTSFAVFVLVGAILTPAVLLAQLRPPPMDISTGVVPDGKVGIVIARFIIELLLTATVVGGLAGWWLGHTPRASFATALAGFIFALGPGHNIPFLGSTPAVGKGIVLLVITIAISAVVLVESQAWLANPHY